MSPTFRRIALQRAARLFDLVAVSVTFFAAFAIAAGAYTWSNLTHIFAIRIAVVNVLFLVGYLGLCSVIFSIFTFYRSHRLSHWSRRVREIVLAVTLITGILLLLRTPLVFSFATNTFLLIFWLLTTAVLLLSHIAAQRLLYYARSRGRNLRSIVIIGEGREAAALAERIESDPARGYRVLRIIDAKAKETRSESQVVAELESIIAHQPIDEVLVALPPNKYGDLVETIVRRCEEEGIIVRVRTEMFELQVARSYVDELEGVPVVTIRSGPQDDWQLGAKRLIDIVASSVLLAALAPLFAAIALLIRSDSPGPVFFKQERIGFNKRRFKLLKFRTMVDGADAQQDDLEDLNEAEGPVFKIKNDPRVTGLGRFLRRCSIDELPQLVNVLKGDMSLVGPRPLPVRDVERIEVTSHKRRFSIKPGITCLWQVNGRSNIGFDDWVRLDLEYIDKWSLGLDLRILLKTIPAVLKGLGAY